MIQTGLFTATSPTAPRPVTGPSRQLTGASRRGTTVHLDGHLTNARELASVLGEPGRHVLSESELLAELFDALGPACLDRVQGHFAIAIRAADRLVLARDGFGTKLLHFHVSPDRSSLVYASTLWDVASHLEARCEIDLARLGDFLIFGQVLGRGTLLRDVSLVPPATAVIATAADGELTVNERPLPPVVTAFDRPATREDAVDQVIALLEQAIGSCLYCRPDVSIALSGGLDSAVVALFVHARSARPIRSYTLHCKADSGDARAAGQLAARLGFRHADVPVTMDEYLRAIPYAIRARGSATLGGITILLLSARAAEECRDCMGGFVADDVFGEAYMQRNWATQRSRLQHRLRRATMLGLPVSDDARAALEAAMRTRGYEEFYETMGDLDQGVGWIDACAAANGIDVHMPFCSENLYAYVRTIPRELLPDAFSAADKALLREATIRKFGRDALATVLPIKRTMPDAIATPHARFVELCNAAVDDASVRRHEFGAWAGDRQSLVMLDIFTQMFRDRRRPEDIDLEPFLGTYRRGAVAAG